MKNLTLLAFIPIVSLAALATIGACQKAPGPIARFFNAPARLTDELKEQLAQGAVQAEVDVVQAALAGGNARLQMEASALVRTAAEADPSSAVSLGPLIPALLILTRSSDRTLKSNSLASLILLNPSPPLMLAGEFETLIASPDRLDRSVGLHGLLRLSVWDDRQRGLIKEALLAGSRDSLLGVRQVVSENTLKKRNRPGIATILLEILPMASQPNGLVLVETIGIASMMDLSILQGAKELADRGRVNGEVLNRLKKLLATSGGSR